MVRPAFENLDPELWLHRRRAENTVCIFHSSVGVGAPILEALGELEEGERPTQRTLTFKPRARPKPLRKLQLKLVDSTDELRVMNITVHDEAVTIQMTPFGLDVFRDAINSWLNGSEDFSVSSQSADLSRKKLGPLDRSSLELWFWGPSYYAP